MNAPGRVYSAAVTLTCSFQHATKADRLPCHQAEKTRTSEATADEKGTSSIRCQTLSAADSSAYLETLCRPHCFDGEVSCEQGRTPRIATGGQEGSQDRLEHDEKRQDQAGKVRLRLQCSGSVEGRESPCDLAALASPSTVNKWAVLQKSFRDWHALAPPCSCAICDLYCREHEISLSRRESFSCTSAQDGAANISGAALRGKNSTRSTQLDPRMIEEKSRMRQASRWLQLL